MLFFLFCRKNTTNGVAVKDYKVIEPFTIPCNINLELKTAEVCAMSPVLVVVCSLHIYHLLHSKNEHLVLV